MIKKNRLKKPVSVLLSVLMLLSLFVPVSAIEDGYEVSTRSQVPKFNDGASYSQDVSALEDLVDLDEFSQYLIDSFYDCPENSVDISQFGIPYSSDNATAIYHLIWNEIPELFQIYSLICGYSSSSKKITSIRCGTYSYTADEYHEMYEKTEKAANEMVADLVNSGLSDVEKALLIHDRMVAFCEYDYDNYLTDSIPMSSRNIYGVLVLGDAVCQGYAMAYEYLLRKVGVEAHYMSSDALNHAWNNVYIDGAWYYVDATWDDPVWDVNGRVKHTNFLQSYEKFSERHSENGETDYEILEPANSTYDEFYWTNVNTAFQYLDGNYYYVDVSGNTLKKTSDLIDSSKSETLLSFGKWTINSSGTYYSNTYAKLSNDGQSLLYSLQDGVYRYNIATGASETVWKPTAPSGMSNPCVYGFGYDGGYLTCVYNSSPNFDGDTKNLYTQKKLYDIKEPYGEITSTNDVAQSQTVTLSLSDNVEVDGYYWGSNADYTKNSYAQASAESVEKTVSQAGTYYLTVKDTSGNLSETVSITMLQTTLDANEGFVTPAYVLTESGKSFVLPSAERSGYNHLGWTVGGDSAVTYEAGESYTPTENASLISIWSCKHEKYNSEVTTAATCSKEGVMTYTCATCGDTYTEPVEKISHTVVTDAAVAATCTTEGKTEGSHCSVCGAVLVAQKTIAATNHSYRESLTKEATCTQKGVLTHICSKCGDTYTTDIDMISHTVVKDEAVAATCTTDGKTEGSHCSVCGLVITAQKTVPVKEHTYTTVVVTPATCTNEGVQVITCTVCGQSQTQTIPLVSHSDSNGDGVCDECGSILENPSENCSCICHKTGFAGFIYKIIRIFWKLFGINKTCDCGINHY